MPGGSPHTSVAGWLTRPAAHSPTQLPHPACGGGLVQPTWHRRRRRTRHRGRRAGEHLCVSGAAHGASSCRRARGVWRLPALPLLACLSGWWAAACGPWLSRTAGVPCADEAHAVMRHGRA
eukprot:11572810-Alexandrium_andersonii.AAC.1